MVGNKRPTVPLLQLETARIPRYIVGRVLIV
jgi:hypothetical protein